MFPPSNGSGNGADNRPPPPPPPSLPVSPVAKLIPLLEQALFNALPTLLPKGAGAGPGGMPQPQPPMGAPSPSPMQQAPVAPPQGGDGQLLQAVMMVLAENQKALVGLQSAIEALTQATLTPKIIMKNELGDVIGSKPALPGNLATPGTPPAAEPGSIEEMLNNV